MRLDCMLANCPNDGKMVSYLVCRHCPQFKGQEHIGTVECSHSKADNTKIREFTHALAWTTSLLGVRPKD